MGHETVLHNFTEQAEGRYPYGGVILDSAGNIYGTTWAVPPCVQALYGPGCGTVFQISANGPETTLYTFTGGADGGNPVAGVIVTPKGKLFGTASLYGKRDGGVVFEIRP